MKSEQKKYTVKHIFMRSMICNAAYFVFCAVFMVLVFKNNTENSQDPAPLLFFVCAFAALLSCAFELFLRDEGNNRFLPVAKFWIFYGKIFLFVVYEAVMILTGSFAAVIVAVAVAPVIFLVGIYLVYRKHLNDGEQKKLIIKYALYINETRKKYITFTAVYFVFAALCAVWLTLEIVLGDKLADGLSLSRIILSAFLSVINACAAAVNLVHAVKFNAQGDGVAAEKPD